MTAPAPTTSDGGASKQKTFRVDDAERISKGEEFEKKFPGSIWGSERVCPGSVAPYIPLKCR